MPLQIANSDPLDAQYAFISTRLLFSNYPCLKDATRAVFNAGQPKLYDCERDPVLYVMQGESAIVTPHDETIDIIMTDDTTTCITGIIRHRNSGVTCLTHYDRPLEDDLLRESLDALLEKMVRLGGCDGRLSELSNQFDLYLIGGYCDEKRTSEELAIYLLRTFHSLSRFQVNLACAFTGELNTRYIPIGSIIRGEAMIPAPIVYGAAINVKTGTVVSALLDRRSGSHYVGIPLYDIRRASVSFGSAKMYKHIYDPERRLLVIQPIHFDLMVSQEALQSYFSYALRMNDQDILKKFSTSPYVEPEHFVSDNRSVFQFFLNHQNRNITRLYFPTEQPRFFRLYQLLRSTGNQTARAIVQYRWKEFTST